VMLVVIEVTFWHNHPITLSPYHLIYKIRSLKLVGGSGSDVGVTILPTHLEQ